MVVRHRRSIATSKTTLTRPAGPAKLAPSGGRSARASRGYAAILAEVVARIHDARRRVARTVNTVITETYWLIGRRIVEEEQRGASRAAYGDELVGRLGRDLTARFGRGFSRSNLQQMRNLYMAYPAICQTVSGKSQATPEPPALPLTWSHYVYLLALRSDEARHFYETESIRGGWTVRQLQRQIDSQFYERAAMSRDRKAMLARAAIGAAGDELSPEAEIRDPFVLEFLALKDEYSETDLENALIRDLETFLLELGGDFSFVGRQRRLRLGNQWYRIDLLFFHRRLRCLVVIDLKIGSLTHADAGQMHMYLNYAREHWMVPGENPPVGVILCSAKNEAIARYALGNLPNKVVAAEYRTRLPTESILAAQVLRARRELHQRVIVGGSVAAPAHPTRSRSTRQRSRPARKTG